SISSLLFIFPFYDAASIAYYTPSLHDALPIFAQSGRDPRRRATPETSPPGGGPCTASHALRRPSGTAAGYGDSSPIEGWRLAFLDRKSTRLNSSHVKISYAVFCLKKKTTRIHQ